MINIKLPARLAVTALGLLVAGMATAINVRPAAAGPVMVAGLTPGLRMVSAPDFWAKAGAETKHDFQPMMVSDLEKIIRDGDHPDLALRAAKLLCDNAGHSRHNAKFSDADNAKAVKLAFEHLESQFADPEVAKYAPARGFSHMTLSTMDDGETVAWVLIETVGQRPGFNGGLNIRVDLKAGKVTAVKQWGDVRPEPAKK